MTAITTNPHRANAALPDLSLIAPCPDVRGRRPSEAALRAGRQSRPTSDVSRILKKFECDCPACCRQPPVLAETLKLDLTEDRI